MASTRKWETGLLIAAVALVGACTDSTEPARAPTSASITAAAAARLPLSEARGLDAEFTRLARQIPGFGGMYYDKSGTLNVYMTAQRKGAATLRAQDLATQLRTFGGLAVQSHLLRANALGGRAPINGAAVVVQPAAYDFLQLRAYKDRLRSVFRVRGVVYVDIDETANRLHIAMSPGASQAQLTKALVRAGVPQEAVIVSQISPIAPLTTTVQDRLRPVPGGAQITFLLPDEPGFLGVCTVGFDANMPSHPNQRFFVTASHCSQVQGGNEHTAYSQPRSFLDDSTSNLVAVEYKDPQYGDPGGLCFTGFRCRLSDALLARYDSPSLSQFGKIARTTFALQRIGSLIIDQQHRRWTIADELPFPFQGDIANKVGRTTGWTAGPVIATCADVQETGTDIVEICQDFVEAGSGPGDSGAGVFERVDSTSSNVLLTGILWGGGTLDGAPVFVMSAMENVEFELGPLITSLPPTMAAVQ